MGRSWSEEHTPPGEYLIVPPEAMAEPEALPPPAEFNYSAPAPLPPNWKPGFGIDDEGPVVFRAPPEPLHTIQELGIGPRDPYPSKEDNNGTALPPADHGADGSPGEP